MVIGIDKFQFIEQLSGVLFGRYYQSKSCEKEPIEWLVIEKTMIMQP